MKIFNLFRQKKINLGATELASWVNGRAVYSNPETLGSSLVHKKLMQFADLGENCPLLNPIKKQTKVVRGEETSTKS